MVLLLCSKNIKLGMRVSNEGNVGLIYHTQQKRRRLEKCDSRYSRKILPKYREKTLSFYKLAIDFAKFKNPKEKIKKYFADRQRKRIPFNPLNSSPSFCPMFDRFITLPRNPTAHDLPKPSASNLSQPLCNGRIFQTRQKSVYKQHKARHMWPNKHLKFKTRLRASLVGRGARHGVARAALPLCI